MKSIKSLIGTALITMSVFFSYSTAFAQNTWSPKANLPALGRIHAVGFSIGNKGYIGTGKDSNSSLLNDFWEWNQATNVWTQKANVGGPGRFDAVGFSIGNKGYIGTGLGGGPNGGQDFWEYDPTLNNWTQKSYFGGSVYWAVGFSIGTKGYIGTGSGSKDFWEYDQAADVWTKKADFGGGQRQCAVGFSIGTMGYIGTGWDCVSGLVQQDFWEWNQSTNIWTQKANLPGPERWVAVGFSIGNKGYIGTGADKNTTPLKDFWQWDQATNTWTQEPDYGGGPVRAALGFAIGNYGYIGMGSPNSNKSNPTNDFWEYGSSCVASAAINSDPAPNITFCVGQNVYLSASGGTSYVWNTGDTGANIAATLSVTTTYSVTATDAAGCTGTASTTFIVDPNCTTTGVSPFNSGSLQSGIWPNPSNGIFTLGMAHGIATGAGMEIFNVFGERVYQSVVSGLSQTVDISGQPNGIYMLKLASGKETVFAKIIIRQ